MRFKAILIVFLFLILAFVSFFFVGFPEEKENIVWGVNFSQKHSQQMGLDWKENYLALLDDLEVKKIKVATYWDLIEKERGEFSFEDLDWQIKEAEKRGAEVMLVLGMKTPRWPECHIPFWVNDLDKKEQKERILNLIEKIVSRYSEEEAIWAWQVENEPFFEFGRCPWQIDEEFLKREISKVKSSDDLNRPVLISESGEFSFWFKAASLGDIVGTTLYRRVWAKEIKSYFTHILPPTYYSRRAKLIGWFFGKEVICVEMQAEPWGPTLLYDSSLEEQFKSMNPRYFSENISFAKKSGFDEIYLWGSEWWYWMKEKRGDSRFWEEIKGLTGSLKEGI